MHLGPRDICKHTKPVVKPIALGLYALATSAIYGTERAVGAVLLDNMGCAVYNPIESSQRIFVLFSSVNERCWS